MKIAKIKHNDVVDGVGICVSYWAQGCPFHCKNCHNQETWSFEAGESIELADVIAEILEALDARGVARNFSVLGGEPLCDENISNTYAILKAVRDHFEGTRRQIFLWTGFTYEVLLSKPLSKKCLGLIDVLIDGPYIDSLRDISLYLRGSSNQRVLYLRDGQIINIHK